MRQSQPDTCQMTGLREETSEMILKLPPWFVCNGVVLSWQRQTLAPPIIISRYLYFPSCPYLPQSSILFSSYPSSIRTISFLATYFSIFFSSLWCCNLTFSSSIKALQFTPRFLSLFILLFLFCYVFPASHFLIFSVCIFSDCNFETFISAFKLISFNFLFL